MPLISEVTHHMALLPVVWLALLQHSGQRRALIWWVLALVLGFSWLADTVAHWASPWLVSALYPLAQAVTLATVLLPFAAAWRFAAALLSAGAVVLWVRGIEHPDTAVHTVAWVGILLMLWKQRGRLRLTILSAFGLGWLGYLGYALAPSWPTWGVYQGIRATSLGIFCWATAPRRVPVRVAT